MPDQRDPHAPAWDPFAEAEAEARAMVLDPRWPGLSVPAKAQALAARILVTPDGARWLYGAHGRWHVQDPSDGRWHLAPPPRGCPATRVPQPALAVIPPLIPSGPDCVPATGSVQGFIGPDVPEALTEHIRVLLRANGRRSCETFPLTAFADVFASDVPGTVAAIWGAVMWSAYAPAFDGNERLITIFGEYLGRPLPGDEWVRWLPATPLLSLATLFAERVRADQHRAALRLVALMADTAHALAADPRFLPRADALVAILDPLLRRPDLDDRAALLGDHAVLQAWLARCPARFDRALLGERAPGEAFRHALYDLTETLAFAPAPLPLTAAFLADLPDPGSRMPAWLDHRLRAHLKPAPSGQAWGSASFPAAPTRIAPVSDPTTGSWHPEPAEQTGAWHPHTGPQAGAQTGAWQPEPDERTGAWDPRTEDSGATGRSWAAAAPSGTGAASPSGTGTTERSGSGVAERSGTGATVRPAPPYRKPPAEIEALEPPDRATAAAILGAAYATALAWCRLVEEEPGRFAGPAAMAERIVHERDDPHVNH
ncbi:hypothetical protein [Nonomuraea sp. NPDC050310]|uniref:hypothetical protein n=1 Tax=Nonomuraea sp. NPDC050310 TaxID=3154935 RepID=UPI0033F07D03